MARREDHLTYEDSLKLLADSDSIPVRICPLGRTHCGGSEWGRGSVVSAHPRYAVVHPFRHKRTEKIDWKHLRLWQSGVEQQRNHSNNRANKRKSLACV
jgi:hypothetical protein